jgi:PAS domain S-box-containing protein
MKCFGSLAGQRASERDLRELTETIPQMLWSADAAGGIDYCNHRALDYTGISLEQVRGTGWMRTLRDCWSRLDNLWEGVATREILNRVQVAGEVRYVLVHAFDQDWTTNMPFDQFAADDALFADTHDGQPLPLEHGGPLRLIVPRLYAWKSAKWVRGFELLASDRAGYWEEEGYHMKGDPWKEERFR